MSFISASAEEYGIDDLKLDEIYTDLGCICYYKSSKYADLTDEEKFNLLFAAKEATQNKSDPFSDCESKEYKSIDDITDIRIRAGSDEYSVGANRSRNFYALIKNRTIDDDTYVSNISYGSKSTSSPGNVCPVCGEVYHDDEFDDEDVIIDKIADNCYIVDGSMPLDDLNEKTGSNLESQTSETIGGFVIDLIGEIPEDGYVNTNVEYENYTFNIISVSERRIRRLKMTINDAGEKHE